MSTTYEVNGRFFTNASTVDGIKYHLKMRIAEYKEKIETARTYGNTDRVVELEIRLIEVRSLYQKIYRDIARLKSNKGKQELQQSREVAK